MKKIILVRHAHPQPPEPLTADIERHIDDIGIEEASLISRFLTNANLSIDKVLSSPAIRALETAEFVCEKLHIDKKNIEIDQRIYMNTLEDLIDVIHEMDNSRKVVMLFGHNPSFSQLATYLSGDNSLKLPTCGTCDLTCDKNNWSDVTFHDAKCLFLETPDHLSE